MAIIKLAETDPLESGRRNGTRFFRVGNRTIARQITIPNDPAQPLRLERRSGLAGGAKVWSSVLSPAEQEAWTAASRFAFRGQLELCATSVEAEVIGEPQPTTRGVGLAPAAPVITAFNYDVSPETLTIDVNQPTPAANFATIWKVNGPLPQTRQPTITEMIVFRTAIASSGTTNLLPDYKSQFVGSGPAGRNVFIELAHFNKVIPAAAKRSQLMGTPQDQANAAWATLDDLAMAKLGTAGVEVFPLFTGIAIGAEIALRVTAADFTTTLPATVPNFQSASGTITDTLGISRSASLRLTLDAGGGRFAILQLAPDITI